VHDLPASERFLQLAGVLSLRGGQKAKWFCAAG
jgi:hypothetical protein